MNITIILIGFIFVIIIAIIFVYLFYYNRILPETALITDLGVTISPISNRNVFMTLQSLQIAGSPLPRNNIILADTGGSNMTSSTQGWVFFNSQFREITVFTNQSISTTDRIVPLVNGEIVYIRNSFTGGYISYTSDSQVFADSRDSGDASAFIIEIGANLNNVAFRANPAIVGQGNYMIPSNTGLIVIGPDDANNIKTWIINN